MPDAVMLFAAGFGTRMMPLTKDRPKPMVEVGGQPLIDHTLDLAEAISPRVIAANMHYKPDTLARHLAHRGVETILEEPDILDTGGGLRNALPVLGNGAVFTLNTDAVWKGPNPLTLLKSAWRPDKMDALLMCVPLTSALGHTGAGDFEISVSGRLSRGPGAIYGGAQIIKTDTLKSVSDKVFSLNLLWDMMLEARTLYGLTYDGVWCDVGHPNSIPIAEALLRDGHV